VETDERTTTYLTKMEVADFFSRGRLLLGDETMAKLASKRVILFGVGGVGSWCAEGLIRSGITDLTIVDCDVVCESNINRQLMATSKTVGKVKVEVLKERLLDINPAARITAKYKVFNENTASDFELENFDYIIDAIDSLKDKAFLILSATRTSAFFISSMGAALKLDPMKINVTEFWKVRGCPLAAALRRRFKTTKSFPMKKFKCIYSEELVRNQAVQLNSEYRVNGSLVHITAIYGFIIVGLVIQDISQ